MELNVQCYCLVHLHVAIIIEEIAFAIVPLSAAVN